MRRFIYIDTETQNALPIKQAGSIRYAETARVLIITWCADDKTVRTWETGNGPIPEELYSLAEDPEVLWVAHNAMFDRTALATEGIIPKGGLSQWVDTSALARYCGLPGGLGAAARAAKVPPHLLKTDDSGGIRLFTRERHYKPEDRPDEWRAFVAYAEQDTLACRALHRKLSAFLRGDPLRYWQDRERKVYEMDQRINHRGFYADREVLHHASMIIAQLRPRYVQRLKELTLGYIDTLQSPRLLDWVNSRLDPDQVLPNLQKSTVADALEENLPDEVVQALHIRQVGARNSLAKYSSMDIMQGEDGRVRGGFLYHGAHTGRWSGQACQPQNLARPIHGLDPVRIANDVVLTRGDPDAFASLYEEDPFTVLMSGIRGAITAPPGRVLVVADYAQIEARITAWYAGETDLLAAFASGEDVYTKVALDVLKKADRFAGKTMLLGLGYGMGPPKFSRINKLDLQTAEQWVYDWRNTYSGIVSFWYTLQRAFDTRSTAPGNVRIRRKDGGRVMYLPSGMPIFYHRVHRERDEETGRWQTFYANVFGSRSRLWGGTLTENLVQGTAREVMAEHMLELEAAGHKIVVHAHDELVVECDEDKAEATLRDMYEIMGRTPSWLLGCPIKVEGGIVKRYTKL